MHPDNIGGSRDDLEPDVVSATAGVVVRRGSLRPVSNGCKQGVEQLPSGFGAGVSVGSQLHVHSTERRQVGVCGRAAGSEGWRSGGHGTGAIRKEHGEEGSERSDEWIHISVYGEDCHPALGCQSTVGMATLDVGMDGDSLHYFCER